jgi:hypothetical protein
MGGFEWDSEMSALDDLIASNAAPQQASPLDALIATNAQAASGAQPASAPAAVQPPQPPQPPQQGAPGYLASLGAGLGHGFGNTVLGAQELLGKGLSAVGSDNVGPWLVNDAQQGVKNLDSQNQPYAAANPITNTAGKIGGNIVATAPLATLAPAAATATALGRIGTGAAVGAASGAMTPSDPNSQEGYWQQKGTQAGTGAAFGAGGATLANALGKVISGANGTAQRTLANAGVTMTPGQTLGGGFARTEDKLTSVPILGDMIKNAQQRSVQSFNKAVYNDVLAPIGKTYDGPVGQDAVQAVKSQISNAYDGALSNMTFKATDPLFQKDISNLTGLAQNLPAQQQQTFMNILKTQVMGKLGPQGNMDGPTLKGAQSELSRIASGYSSDASFDNRQLGAAVGEIKNAIDTSLTRYNAPGDVQALSNANAAYAKFVRLRAAAGSQGAMNNDGIFTAGQLQNAVRSADKSVGKGATATGNALMQDLSSAGQNVLGSKYPDSGTPGRAALMGILGALGGGGATAAGFGVPTLAAAATAGLAALPYTGIGQRATQAALMSRPSFAQPVGQFVQKGVSPFAAALGAALTNH